MGRVYFEHRISYQWMAIRGKDASNEEMNYRVTNLILKIMPEGAKYISTFEVGAIGLARVYVLNFEHPLFEENTKIDLEWRRDCYIQEPPFAEDQPQQTVVQLAVFTGIRYIKPDGVPRYPEASSEELLK